MISPIRNLILALSLLAPLGGEEEQAAPTAPPPAALIGTNWNLVSLTVETKVTPLPDNHGMTLAIGEDGRISGYGGVNRFFGSLQEKNGALAWSPIGSTRRGGPPEAMTAESTYLRTISSTTQFKITEDTLVLSNKDESTALTFTIAKKE